MLDLTKRLIAIPSENPPGDHYEECACILSDELRGLGFDDVRREGACVLASAGTGPRTLYFSGSRRGLWSRFEGRPVDPTSSFQSATLSSAR